MNSTRRIAILLALGLLAAALVGSWITRGAMQYLPFLHRHAQTGMGSSQPQSIVDQAPWKTAEAAAALAVSTEERDYARSAERLADHEVDQAFAQALREANATPRKLTGETQALEQRIKQLEATVKQDQAAVAALAPKGSPASGSASGAAPPNDDLEVAKAQLGLDQDELSAAQEELSRKTGDPRVKIQQELTAREASMKAYDARANNDSAAQTAIVSAGHYNTLAGQISAWTAQHTRQRLLVEARQQADSDAATLTAGRAQMKQQAATSAANSASATAAGETKSSHVKDLQQMAAQQNILSIVEDRIATQQQLAAVYAAWISQLQLQHKIVLHLLMQSLVLIAVIVLLTILAGWILQIGLANWSRDPRQRQTLKTVLNLATLVAGLLLLLLVIFGAPRQTPTILGLATAGLTVVFQDFILAFCGWFVLMGKHGIRVGDWVEIDGVGGEVVSVSVFRTWLLETGNWTANGHPTGRRVSFLNGFAIKSKYFNFSTASQWMWDEIKVTIPPGADTYGLIERIRAAALKETAKDARMAEQEWRSVSHAERLPQFSAQPSVAMRPAGAGVDVVLRYVTRAGVRLETRNKLFRMVVELMLGPSPANLPVEPEVPSERSSS